MSDKTAKTIVLPVTAITHNNVPTGARGIVLVIETADCPEDVNKTGVFTFGAKAAAVVLNSTSFLTLEELAANAQANQGFSIAVDIENCVEGEEYKVGDEVRKYKKTFVSTFVHTLNVPAAIAAQQVAEIAAVSSKVRLMSAMGITPQMMANSMLAQMGGGLPVQAAAPAPVVAKADPIISDAGISADEAARLKEAAKAEALEEQGA